jgi:hypothetical protein
VVLLPACIGLNIISTVSPPVSAACCLASCPTTPLALDAEDEATKNGIFIFKDHFLVRLFSKSFSFSFVFA